MHELTWLWKVPMELVTSRPSAVGLLEFRAVSRDDDDAWRAVDAILAESFRGNSYRGVAEFRHVFPISAKSSPVFYPNLIGAYLDGELVSFACMEYFMAERVWYMWFMATKAEFQSKGIGRALVEHVQEKSFGLFDQPGASTLGVVAECEAPTSDAVENDATRRVEFYEKCGFLRANVDALAPPFGAGETEPFPYWLMVWSENQAESIDVAAVLRRIYGRSALNGPHALQDACWSFSVQTMGHAPRYADEMLAAWRASDLEALAAAGHPLIHDDELICVWLTPKAETRRLAPIGYGAVAVEPIARGEIVGILGGFVVDERQLDRMTPWRRSRAIQVTAREYLVGRELPEPGDLFNHSCSPTCGLAGSSLLVTMRDVEPGEELTFDYAMCDASDYDEFVCLCGQPNCRGVVRGTDWRDPVLQARYAGYHSPYLTQLIAALPNA